MYAANLEFATKVPAKAADGTPDKSPGKSKDGGDDQGLTAYGDPAVLEAPHAHLNDH